MSVNEDNDDFKARGTPLKPKPWGSLYERVPLSIHIPIKKTKGLVYLPINPGGYNLST